MGAIDFCHQIRIIYKNLGRDYNPDAVIGHPLFLPRSNVSFGVCFVGFVNYIKFSKSTAQGYQSEEKQVNKRYKKSRSDPPILTEICHQAFFVVFMTNKKNCSAILSSCNRCTRHASSHHPLFFFFISSSYILSSRIMVSLSLSPAPELLWGRMLFNRSGSNRFAIQMHSGGNLRQELCTARLVLLLLLDGVGTIFILFFLLIVTPLILEGGLCDKAVKNTTNQDKPEDVDSL